MAQLKAKHQETQQAFDTERRDWLNDKNLLENTIADLSILEKQSEGDRTSRETAVREYEERVKVSLTFFVVCRALRYLCLKAAEERYTSEVVVHAESIKVIGLLRQQLADTQTSLRDNIAAAETARANLSTSEGSWKQQKDALSKEIADLNARHATFLSSL
jgi:nucleoprotein TPR